MVSINYMVEAENKTVAAGGWLYSHRPAYLAGDVGTVIVLLLNLVIFWLWPVERFSLADPWQALLGVCLMLIDITWLLFRLLRHVVKKNEEVEVKENQGHLRYKKWHN